MQSDDQANDAEDTVKNQETIKAVPPVTSDISAPSRVPISSPDRGLSNRIFSKRSLVVFAAVVVISLGVFGILAQRSSDKVSLVSQSEQKLVSPKNIGVAVALSEGTVEYSQGQDDWKKLTATTDLSEGVRIRTAAASRAILQLDDGSAIRLDASTDIALTKLEVDDIRIENVRGQVYTRVIASDKRRFSVLANGQSYTAKGTAYRTLNTDTEKGVEVFHSSVEIDDKKITVNEGSAYFAKSASAEKAEKTVSLDPAILGKDTFLKWNASEDEKNKDLSDKLGVLASINKPVPTPTPTPQTTPQPTQTPVGIVLSGSVSEYDAIFQWTVKGAYVSQGFKLVRNKSGNPTYPNDSVAYIDAGKTSHTYFSGDGVAYVYRLCAYRGDKCDSYSNSVTLTTKKKEKPIIQAGAVSLTLTGSTLSWTFAGTAPNGFKVVMSDSTSPTYPANSKQYLEGTSTSVPSNDLTSGQSYYIRVCKYTGDGCQDYSNEITYLAP